MPGTFDRQPTSRNLLSPVGFKFALDKAPKVDFFSNYAGIPAITLGSALQTRYGKNIDIPGDSSISVGDIVNVKIPKNDAQTDSNNITLDPIMSGKYLITGLRHQLVDDKYFCHAQLCKDSMNLNLNYSPPFNSGWNLAINS